MSEAVANGYLGLPGVDTDLARDIQDDLVRVEDSLRTAVTVDDPLLAESAAHLLGAGGKRFRATLVLLAARFGDAKAPELIPAATVVELTHVATLYHDDVMDEAELRRGSASANLRWGNSVAILTGDYVFAQASMLLADLGAEAVRLQASTFSRLVRGQILETSGPAPGADAVEHYLEVIADKTASLIATSSRFGAMFSGAAPEVVEAVTRAGEALGMAFQLSDDLIDVAADATSSGKEPGTDLREGVLTLPMFYALRESGPEADRLRELLGRPLDDTETAEALTLLRSRPAMERALADLRGWADRARDELSALPMGPARDALATLCDYVVERSG